MKINPNRELQAAPTSRARKIARPSAPAPDFTASAKLALKLAATPTVRTDKVARAKALITDPNYPDSKTIRAVARQLADKIHPSQSAES